MQGWEKKASGDVEQALLEAAWAGDEAQCRVLALAGADMGSRMGYGSTIGAMGARASAGAMGSALEAALEAAGSDSKKLSIAIDWCYEGMWSAPSDEVWMACALALPAWAVGRGGDNALMAAGGNPKRMEWMKRRMESLAGAGMMGGWAWRWGWRAWAGRPGVAGENLMHHCARSAECLEWMERHGFAALAKKADDLGVTPLMLAAGCDVAVVEKLLPMSNPRALDAKGRCAMEWAIRCNQNRQSDALAILETMSRFDPEWSQIMGWRLLSAATDCGAMDVARFYATEAHVENYKVFHERKAARGVENPLIGAALAGDANLCRILAQWLDIDAMGERGERALAVAARSGSVEVVEALLSAGADPNARSAGGCSALMAACQAGRVDAACALLDVSDPLALDDMGCSALDGLIWGAPMDPRAKALAWEMCERGVPLGKSRGWTNVAGVPSSVKKTVDELHELAQAHKQRDELGKTVLGADRGCDEGVKRL